MEEGRAHYASNPRFATTSQYANVVEENAAKKRQRSKDGSKVEAPGSKRQKPSSGNNNNNQQQKTKSSDVAKRHLIVALLDRKNPLGDMTMDQWKLVEMRLIEVMFEKMVTETPMPAFDGACWYNGVKILKCKDDPTLAWLKEVVPTLQGLWEGDKKGTKGTTCVRTFYLRRGLCNLLYS